jgi:imidazole glycerol-phosphate synthase subunit HisH
MTAITVVDYGAGNLLSVQRALEKCGATVQFATSAADIASASRLVLPGVGAFADGMAGLRERGLVDELRKFGASGRPMLGICLGMQLLMTESEEFGVHVGLDLIAGRVVPIPRTAIDGRPHKIPHIGWSALQIPPGLQAWSDGILADVRPGEAVYLVHSFAVMPQLATHRLADCDYNGRTICAALRMGNLYGCQFHPEKSGLVGLKILSRFIRS